MNKVEMLRIFLLGGEISAETKRQRLGIAWDIWESLPKIIQEEMTLLFEEVKERLVEKLSNKDDWIIQNAFKFRYEKWSGVYLFKKSWTSEGNYLLSVALEPDNWSIVALTNMFISVRKSDSIEKVDFKSMGDELNNKFKRGSVPLGAKWVWYNYLEKYRYTNNRDFFEELASDRGKIIQYYAENLLSLKEASEIIIDKTIEGYKPN